MIKKIPPELRGKRFNSISDCLKDEFGKKTIKLAIDGGFTCPNRDGSKGLGGCTFCSDTGSGEFSSDIDTQIGLLSDKWPDAKYMAYLQNHTNTYAAADKLREIYSEILKDNDCVKISDLAVNGKDLMEKGITEGPQIGMILTELLERVMDEPKLNTREKLLELVDEKCMQRNTIA